MSKAIKAAFGLIPAFPAHEKKTLRLDEDALRKWFNNSPHKCSYYVLKCDKRFKYTTIKRAEFYASMA